MTTRLEFQPYSRKMIAWVRKQGLKVEGVEKVRHIYPRVYCVAKPAPLCAVVIAPWMDSEPQVPIPEKYQGAFVVNDGAEDIEVGEWCAMAYLISPGKGTTRLFKLPVKE